MPLLNNSAFAATHVAQATVIGLFFKPNLGFLWYNVVGCGIVVALSLVFELMCGVRSPTRL